MATLCFTKKDTIHTRLYPKNVNLGFKRKYK
jgi:hypothetical protein